MSITRRAIPDASSLDEAIDIVRGNWLRAIEQHHQQYSVNSTVEDILDIGCSVGWSTRFLANTFPSANVIVRICSYSLSISSGIFHQVILVLRWLRNLLLQGLDLSPYFLAVAQYKEKNIPSNSNCIKWVHANGEDTGLPAKSFDVVSIAYVVCVT